MYAVLAAATLAQTSSFLNSDHMATAEVNARAASRVFIEQYKST
jgi:hypothetical protein